MLFNKVFFSVLFSGYVTARPSQSLKHKHHKRVLTQDNTCGNIAAGENHGYICDPSNSWGGACCSQNGYCGNTTAYCGVGCQDAFGTCDGLLTFTSIATPYSSPPLITFSSRLVVTISSSASSAMITISPPSTTSIFGSSSTTTSSTASTATSTLYSTSSIAAAATGGSYVGTSPPPVQSGCLWEVSGSGSFTHSQTFDFTNMIDFPTADLSISNYGVEAGTAPHSQMYNSDQVSVGDGSLQLKVPGGQATSPIYGAEVQTTIRDILYGSVRTMVQISEVPGTCHGLFYYKDDNQESDIEILTADLASGAHYTNQATVPGEKSTTATHQLPSNATMVMHEYRLDWLPGKTVYYLDGVQQQVLTSNVPDSPGSWLWNNWSNGDAKWSAGPPETDSVLRIEKIEMYYNRTGNAGTC